MDSKPTKIAFANSKGGVTKTTSCLTMGCCLAELGYRVLMLDLDHQANLSDDVGRGDEDYTITDLFENPKFDLTRALYPALANGEVIPNLDVIPADITLAVGARSAERYRHRLNLLEDGLKPIESGYDFILMDLRPAIDLSNENALLISDLTVIPVDMDVRATKGISDLFEVIRELKRSDSFRYVVLRTKVDSRNAVMLNHVNASLEEQHLLVLPGYSRVSELYKKATKERLPVTFYAPNQRPHQDYRRITNALLDSLKIKGNRFKTESESLEVSAV